MIELDEIISKLIKFRDDRDWEQFHNPKDLAIALNIESSELLELFLWKSSDEADIEKVKEELADVLIYALLISRTYNLDIFELILAKLAKNEAKYPIDKSRGNATKYECL